MSSPRAPAIAASPPEQPTLEELRKRYGTDDDDDLLILKALIPESAIEAMQAAGPVERDFLQRNGSLQVLSSPEIDEVSELIASARTPYVRVATEAWEVELRRG
jgi:oxaloacetate decarboxylase alpha subunit